MAQEQNNPDALAQILANMQAQLATITERLDRGDEAARNGQGAVDPGQARQDPVAYGQRLGGQRQAYRGPPERDRRDPQDDPYDLGEDDDYPEHGRARERHGQHRRDQDRSGHFEVKVTAPTFAGRLNPEAYLEWENRMEHIFGLYHYTEEKKVAFASAQLTENALAWWDRDVAERRRHRYAQIITWEEMRYQLRKRYIPPYYYRDLQQRFRRCTQKNRTVEEYFNEFESLKNRLETEETEEALMAQFLDGLNDRIARKVERQPYHDLHDMLHIANQAEQHIKKKTAPTRTQSQWNTPPSATVDKGKAPEVDNRYKKPVPEAGKFPQGGPSKPANPNPTRARDITCFKCQGRGHMQRDCPNQRIMILTVDGGYESQDEEEGVIMDDDEIEYPDVGELLVTRRVLSAVVEPEAVQRENIFHTRCTVNAKVCSLIIDGGSCANVASKYMIDKLGLKTQKHPRPYKLQWLNDEAELKISEQVTVPFSIGRYQDEVICDVVPMKASHLLLGRPWQFDKETLHHGRTNHYSFVHNKRKFKLAPLTPLQVHEMQAKMAKDAKESKSNFYANSKIVTKAVKHQDSVLLMVLKEEATTSPIEHVLPEEVSQVLGRFQDVFPEEIPAGLPPIRGIEHQTDGQTEVVNRTLSQLLRVTLGKNAKNWLDCLPFVEFAYNRANHSATKFSLFELVYGFNPATPMDLSPLPPTEVTSLDGEAKAESVRRLQEKARENLEKKTAQIKAYVDKKRTEMVYKPGDWVWLHMRPERFPKQRKSKLDPRGDGPFRVLERVNNNAYKLELPEDVRISTTFNVSDLSPFAMDEDYLDEEALQEGGNDEDIDPPTPTMIPSMSELPRTRQGIKRLREEFDQGVASLLSLMDQGPLNLEEEGPMWTWEHHGPDLKTIGLEGNNLSPQQNQDRSNSSPSPVRPIKRTSSSFARREVKVVFVITTKETPPNT